MTLVYNHRQPVVTRAIGPVEWTAHELVPIQSIVGQGRHIKLGCIPLRSAERRQFIGPVPVTV